MGIYAMKERTSNAPPVPPARLAGLLYMIVVVASIFALFSQINLFVRGDAAATADNILASEPLFRLGFVALLIGNAAYIGVIAILYELFKPVNATLCVIAAFFGLVGCAVSGVNMVNNLAPLSFLGEASYLAVFEKQQLQALARVSLDLNVVGNDIALTFFGFYCVLIGFLIVGATFLPRVLGLIMLVAGLGWLTNSFTSFLSPPLGDSLYGYLMPISGLSETLFTLWLLLFGVNASKWREQANTRTRNPEDYK
jgi:Domain of unknown function (DUF4386)